MTDLAAEIKKRLPARLVRLVRRAGELAAEQGHASYLVGGVVRDLLLRRRNLDVDAVVGGDAIRLARRLANEAGARLVTHVRFGTASVITETWRVDLTTLRSETYERPGALPTVGPGTIETDLFRRDFTINAMAIDLGPERYGRLIDLNGGQRDLDHRLVRVLHERSFIDDATRIWRAVRYEQRLGFRLEENTESWLRRDVPMLDTISGDRVRHELERVLQEKQPENALMRADELGVLARLHPHLKADKWLAHRFRQARRIWRPERPPLPFYLSILFYRLPWTDVQQLAKLLKLDHETYRVVSGSDGLKDRLAILSLEGQPPSIVHHQLRGADDLAVVANLLCTASAEARRNIELYLDRLRYVRPELNGDDLMELGVPEGPQMKKVLQKLLDGRLDGEINSREEEVEMVEYWLAGV